MKALRPSLVEVSYFRSKARISKANRGGPGFSDEELLLRYIMKGTQEIEAMRAAGPPRQYRNTAPPLLDLLQQLSKNTGVRSIQVQRGSDSLVMQNRSAA